MIKAFTLFYFKKVTRWQNPYTTSYNGTIILCLRIPQLLIEPFLFHKFFMASLLGHPAMLEHQDLIAETAAAHPVGNVNRCPIFYQQVEFFIDLILADGI